MENALAGLKRGVGFVSSVQPAALQKLLCIATSCGASLHVWLVGTVSPRAAVLPIVGFTCVISHFNRSSAIFIYVWKKCPCRSTVVCCFMQKPAGWTWSCLWSDTSWPVEQIIGIIRLSYKQRVGQGFKFRKRWPFFKMVSCLGIFLNIRILRLMIVTLFHTFLTL